MTDTMNQYYEILSAAWEGIPQWFIDYAVKLADGDVDELYGILCSYDGELE